MKTRGRESPAFLLLMPWRLAGFQDYFARWAFSILAHSSFSETARLKTGFPLAESGSTQK